MSDSGDQREPDQLAGVSLPEFQTGVAGHLEPRERLLAQLQSSRIPGGILLHGPQGIGKATLAFDIARQIFVKTGDEDAHHVAEQVASGGYPNLRVLRRRPKETGKGFNTVIRVEEVRDMVERLHKTRGRTGHRVVIVDPIDDCNTASANALLKILEEPPAETVFLLVSHRPGQLLPTIKSRCHAIALRPLADADVRKVLLAGGAEPDRVDHAVELAEGRPRRGFEALAMTDEGTLNALKTWLNAPAGAPAPVHLGIADKLAADKDSAEMAFARDMLLRWIAAEARGAATAAARGRLASANELWDKANLLFADADEYNLDARQTLISLFDAIRKHLQQHTALNEPI